MASNSLANRAKETAKSARTLADQRVKAAQDKYEALQASYNALLGRLQGLTAVEQPVSSETGSRSRRA